MKRIFYVLPLLLFAACSGPGDGFTEIEPGISYKLHVPGETGKKAGENDFYELRMQNKFGGKVFYDSEFMNAQGTILMQSEASRFLSVLAEGDSATFRLPGGDLQLPGMPDTGTVEMNVKVISILSSDEVARRESQSDPDTEEQLLIQRYCRKNGIAAGPDSTGLIYSVMNQGNGAKPHPGDTVRIHYTGSLMNGYVVDDSHRLKDGFVFVFGDDDQVLPGLQNALWHMNAGTKAKLILPSRLAFGQDGSSTGIVPAHTPLVYELELISVE